MLAMMMNSIPWLNPGDTRVRTKPDDFPRPLPLRDDAEYLDADNRLAALRKQLADGEAELHELASIDPLADAANRAEHAWKTGATSPAGSIVDVAMRTKLATDRVAVLRKAVALGEEVMLRIKSRLFREHADKSAGWRRDLARRMLDALKSVQTMNRLDLAYYNGYQAAFGIVGTQAHMRSLGYSGSRENNCVKELAGHFVQTGILDRDDEALVGTGVAQVELLQASREEAAEQAREEKASGRPRPGIVARVMETLESAVGG